MREKREDSDSLVGNEGKRHTKNEVNQHRQDTCMNDLEKRKDTPMQAFFFLSLMQIES